MDYVEGVCLANCWNDLDPGTRQSVASQVAGFIQQLQSVRLNSPVPIGGGPCQGRRFADYSAGSCINQQEIENWFNHKLAICKGSGNARRYSSFQFPSLCSHTHIHEEWFAVHQTHTLNFAAALLCPARRPAPLNSYPKSLLQAPFPATTPDLASNLHREIPIFRIQREGFE